MVLEVVPQGSIPGKGRSAPRVCLRAPAHLLGERDEPGELRTVRLVISVEDVSDKVRCFFGCISACSNHEGLQTQASSAAGARPALTAASASGDVAAATEADVMLRKSSAAPGQLCWRSLRQCCSRLVSVMICFPCVMLASMCLAPLAEAGVAPKGLNSTCLVQEDGPHIFKCVGLRVPCAGANNALR